MLRQIVMGRGRNWFAGAAALGASGTLAAPALAGGSRPGTSEREAVVWVVSLWDGGCSGNTVSLWDDMVDNWYDEIADSKHTYAWTKDGFYHNGDVDDRDFCDADIVSWGIDDWNDRPDDVDAAMIAYHGIDSDIGDDWGGAVRVNDSGDPDCTTSQSHWELGDVDLEFLHISSCFSLDDENWDNDGDGIIEEWKTTFSKLHQLNGFHGIMWIGSSFYNDYENFADDAFDDGVAVSWVENLFDTNISTGNWDQCPVSMVAGSSGTDAATRADDEEYDWVFTDPPTSGTRGWSWRWTGGCDPDQETALPN